MVEVLRGEFTRSRKPSDLTEEQGGYGVCFLSEKSQEYRAVGFGPTRSSDHSHISHLGVSGGEESKPV
jgi:hypothetical protein